MSEREIKRAAVLAWVKEDQWTLVDVEEAEASAATELKRTSENWNSDDSFHAWLEGRGPGGCFINLVDDATGRTLCRLGKEETI
jgi:hypothetical protein